MKILCSCNNPDSGIRIATGVVDLLRGVDKPHLEFITFIKHALASVNSCDITAKALWLSNSMEWYSFSLRQNSCSLWSHSCLKLYVWIWSLIWTSLISRPTCGVGFTTLHTSSCNNFLFSSTYPASYLFSAIFSFMLICPSRS